MNVTCRADDKTEKTIELYDSTKSNHNIKITDDILKSCVKLSERYITDRYLPDKAIDLMDEACACAALRNKAIDDFAEKVKEIYPFTILELEELDSIAEQLKEGVVE